jgi:hypothetical protein
MEEEEKRHNTQGIRPLFDPSDKAGMGHFKLFHKRMVNHTRGDLLSLVSSGEEYKQQLILAQIDLKLLRNQCKEKGPESYLTELIQQHEKNKSILLQKSMQIFEEMEKKGNNDQLQKQFDQATSSLDAENKIITELEHIQNRNRIIVVETTESSNYNAASSSDSEGEED